jgi:hypothetical protein
LHKYGLGIQPESLITGAPAVDQNSLFSWAGRAFLECFSISVMPENSVDSVGKSAVGLPDLILYLSRLLGHKTFNDGKTFRRIQRVPRTDERSDFE